MAHGRRDEHRLLRHVRHFRVDEVVRSACQEVRWGGRGRDREKSVKIMVKMGRCETATYTPKYFVYNPKYFLRLIKKDNI